MKYLVLLLVSATLCAVPTFRDNTYVKLGGSMIAVKKDFDFGPAIAIGKRYLFGRQGVDLSAQYMQGATTSPLHAHTWTIPRALYTQDLGSFYWGAGASFGGSRLEHRKFLGVFAEGLAGFNLLSDAPIAAFIEVGVTQPSIRVRERTHGLYSPTITGTFGIGF